MLFLALEGTARFPPSVLFQLIHRLTCRPQPHTIIWRRPTAALTPSLCKHTAQGAPSQPEAAAMSVLGPELCSSHFKPRGPLSRPPSLLKPLLVPCLPASPPVEGRKGPPPLEFPPVSELLGCGQKASEEGGRQKVAVGAQT